MLELSSLLGDHSLTYEDVLGCIQTRTLQRDVVEREAYHKIYVWLTEMVYHLLVVLQIRIRRYIKSGIRFYRGILDLAAENKPLWVFTVNHDITVELLANHFGHPVKAGFPDNIVSLPRTNKEGEIVGYLDFEFLPRDNITARKYNFFRHGETGINLLKLHGSLDIFASGDEMNYVRLRPREKSVDGYADALKLANFELQYTVAGRRLLVDNEIVYMDENGVMQFLRRTILAGAYKFDKRISQNAPPEALQLFETNINWADELLAVGYSFADEHINSIIKNWMCFNRSRTLLVISPSATVPSGFAHLKPQIRCINSQKQVLFQEKSGYAQSCCFSF